MHRNVSRVAPTLRILLKQTKITFTLLHIVTCDSYSDREDDHHHCHNRPTHAFLWLAGWKGLVFVSKHTSLINSDSPYCFTLLLLSYVFAYLPGELLGGDIDSLVVICCSAITHTLSIHKEGFTTSDFLISVPFDYEPTLLNVLPGLLLFEILGAATLAEPP